MLIYACNPMLWPIHGFRLCAVGQKGQELTVENAMVRWLDSGAGFCWPSDCIVAIITMSHAGLRIQVERRRNGHPAHWISI